MSPDQGRAVPLWDGRGEWERPAGVYEALPERRVLVLAYRYIVGEVDGMVHGGEHTALRSFEVDGLGGGDLVARYARVARVWVGMRFVPEIPGSDGP